MFTEPLSFTKNFLNHWLCRYQLFELKASHNSPQCFEEPQMLDAPISDLV